MLYRGWINGKQVVTGNINELIDCDSIDIFISGFWQVWE
jgi:hypothetical protein